MTINISVCLEGQIVAYLDDGEAEHRSSNVADEHTRKRRDKHVGQNHRPRLRPRLAEHERRQVLIDPCFGQRRRESEATEEQHDDGRPHGREDVRGRGLGIEALPRLGFRVQDAEDYAEEGDRQRRDEEGNGLRMLAS